jgi:hypothetical protein
MAKPHQYARATDKDKKQVETLAGLGVPTDQIALIMGCGETTIKKYFQPELSTGVAKANAKVALWAFSLAERGNPTMIIFLCKTRLGWKDKTEVEHTGDVRVVINQSK